MWKRVSAIVIPSLIAAAILGYMLWDVRDELVTAFEQMQVQFLVLAFAVCILAWVLRGWRYRYILERMEVACTYWFATGCMFISQTANLVIPARLGDLVRLVILKHEKQTPYSTGLSSVVVERAFDIVTVALLGLVSLPFFLELPDWFYLVIIVPLIAAACFTVFLLMAGRIRSENRIIVTLLSILDEVRRASLTPVSLGAISVSSLVIWLIDVLVCAIVAVMFGVQVPFLVVMLAIVIGNLAKAVPITPGGLGTYEATVAFTLHLGGVSTDAAILIAIIDHLIKNLVTLGGGVLSLYAFGDWAFALLKRAAVEGIDQEELRGTS